MIRGDSHYARPEAMGWLERNRVRYVCGLACLLDRTAHLAGDAAVRRAETDTDKVRSCHAFRHAARSWKEQERRVIARIEATRQGSDTRFVVTNLTGTPRWLYEVLYCGRGQAENLIKAHKLHLASDRTSCTRATANQFRLLVHTAAYWLLHPLEGLAPKTSFWRDAQFDTIRLAFIKIAARVTELVTRSRSRCRQAIATSRASPASPGVPAHFRPDPPDDVPTIESTQPTADAVIEDRTRAPIATPTHARSPRQITLMNIAG